MEYNHRLIKATVEKVYNNLIVDVRLENSQIVPAFCGATEIAQMCLPKTTLWLKRTSRPGRVIKYNISFIKTPEGIIFANPRYNKDLFLEAFNNKKISEFAEYSKCKLLGSSDNFNGIDFELTAESGKKCFVFVAPVYNKANENVIFPTSINFFEINMMEEMKKRKQTGAETFVFMIAPREDCLNARFVWNRDANASAAYFEAAKNGLNFLCYGCKIGKNVIEINRKLEILY